MKTTITALRLITPEEIIEHPVLVAEDEHILALGTREETPIPEGVRHYDFPDAILAPGFIDIHIHGGNGHDVMELNNSALTAIGHGMLKHGVTSYLATTVTASLPDTLRSLEHLGKAVRMKPAIGGPQLLGIHLEGPFISHAKRGVHPPDNLLEPSPELLRKMHQASDGTVRMMTIAPELKGSLETIREARELGIESSLGHSNATYAEANAGIEAGARHATHTFNAMRPLDHREPGILGAVLSDDRVTADLIADGLHVAPSVIKLFLAAKGTDRAILITDAISATGMPDGRYKLGGFEVEVKRDRCDLEGKLAGSVLTLDRAVRNVMQYGPLSLQDSVKLATINPARRLGLDQTHGVLAPGRIADAVVLTPQGNVIATMAAGKMFPV
ncbi:MAG TPA: N-acetylglucosamine-6-phosphate deacetylase [Candidatus Angelobacter sp.]|nr:N-acetylglucosamine-6-phosphate deacetylase [Candidatus Angelobacter sp.]